MKKIILAGACSIYGLSQIKKAFYMEGYEVLFADAPFMAGIKIHEYPETEDILYTEELPPCDFVVPLSEFWISYCISHKTGRLSSRALEASRSKIFLYNLMSKNGFDYPEIYGDFSFARKALSEGKRIIVKPEGLHSGYGIEILDSAKENLLEKYFHQAENIKNRTMRIMEIENKGAMITEAVEGTEYSADCFWNEGRFSVVRICKKHITVINDKPCVTVYKLLGTESPEYKLCKKYLEKWTSCLFDKSDVSFAQYDFIVTDFSENKKERVVPIDFACRVGGGISDLLIETGRNLYAEAVHPETEKNLENGKNPENLCQFSYLPTVSGFIKNDNYELIPGKSRIFKKKGDYVISNPSSVGSRIALTVAEFSGQVDSALEEKQLLGEKYISRDNFTK